MLIADRVRELNAVTALFMRVRAHRAWDNYHHDRDLLVLTCKDNTHIIAQITLMYA